jgi:DNA-binding transcriptional regulator GbsR (MarR family)
MPTPKPQAEHRRSLREAQDGFVAVWGKMAGAWGISRTMAEVHALLYIMGEPMCTDEIMERLEISRGNASMSLRALADWGIIVRAHKRGDRKEYYAAEQDVWTMFRAIVRERIKREVDPLLASLHELKDETLESKLKLAGDQAAQARAMSARLESLLEFFQTLEAFSSQFVSPAGQGLQIAASLLSAAPSGREDRTKAPPRELAS